MLPIPYHSLGQLAILAEAFSRRPCSFVPPPFGGFTSFSETNSFLILLSIGVNSKRY